MNLSAARAEWEAAKAEVRAAVVPLDPDGYKGEQFDFLGEFQGESLTDYDQRKSQDSEIELRSYWAGDPGKEGWATFWQLREYACELRERWNKKLDPRPEEVKTADRQYLRCERSWEHLNTWMQHCWSDEQVKLWPDCSHGEECDLMPCPEWDEELQSVFMRPCRCDSCANAAIKAHQAHQAHPTGLTCIDGGELSDEKLTSKLTEYPFTQRIIALAPWDGSISELADTLGDWDLTLHALGRKLRDEETTFRQKGYVVRKTNHTNAKKQRMWEIRRAA